MSESLDAILAGFVLASLVAGGLSFLRSQPASRRQRAARRTSVVSIAEARAGERVRVRGVVRPSGPAMTLPFSRAPGVYHETELTNTAEPGQTTSVVTREACPFIVEDASGSARIAPGAALDVRAPESGSGAVERDDPDTIRVAGDVLRRWFGRSLLLWSQRRIAVGDTITVFGQAAFEPVSEAGAALGGGYREPPRRLVLHPVEGAVMVEVVEGGKTAG